MTVQLLVIGYCVATLCAAAHMHGKPVRYPHNFWASLLNVIAIGALLYFAGFWEPFGL